MNQQLQQAKQNNKELGQVFTPSYIVCSMLNEIHYVVSEHILKKHIIDNSCGNGAFLIEIVYRYIQGSINNDVPKDEIKNDLERYIHGIDNDEMLVNDCINTDGSIQSVPMDYDFDQGSTWWDIITKMRDILPNYQTYFDVEGVFHYEPIPYSADDPIVITDDLWKENVIRTRQNDNK